MSSIERNINDLLALPEIQTAIQAATAAANTANAAAAAAQGSADKAIAVVVAVNSETSLVNSYTSGFSGSLITADSLGNITIANHTRVYGDSALNPTVSVTGSVLATGAASGSVVRIYYVDAARAGGSVSYLFTVDPAPPVAQTGNNHSVGAVTIPAAGSLDGVELGPPGYIYF